MNFKKLQGLLSICIITSLLLSSCTMSWRATPEVVAVDHISAEHIFYVNYYLDPAGNDDNDCLDPSRACLTFQAVMEKAPDDITPSIIMAPGTYTEVENPQDWNVYIHRDVAIHGAGPGSTIITGENDRVPFIFGEDGETLDVRIFDLTITSGGGIVSNNRWNIGSFGTDLMLENVIIENSQGDGITSRDGGSLTLDNVTVQRNRGYGIYAEGLTVIRHSNIVENMDTGVYNSGEMTINDSNISRNHTDHVGGIFNSALGDLTILNSTIDHNSANYATFSRTSGVQNQMGTMTIINSTISNNQFGRSTTGAALSNRGPMELIHVTIANNEGLGLVDYDGGGHYTNVLIVQNDDRNCSIRGTSDVSRTTGVSLDDDDTCENASTLRGFDTIEDAMIGPLQINRGTFTPTRALLFGSPAIDATSEGCYRNDQTAVSRPLGDACDVGAYEFDITEGAETISADVPRMNQDDLCLSGPGQDWVVYSSLAQGLQVELLGVGQQQGWLVVSHPQYPEIDCWVPEGHVDLPNSDVLTGLPTISIPLKPTPSPTPTKEPVEKCYQNGAQIPCP